MLSVNNSCFTRMGYFRFSNKDYEELSHECQFGLCPESKKIMVHALIIKTKLLNFTLFLR